MNSTDWGVLVAQLAVSTAAIAASIFIPPPFGILIGAAIELTGSLAIQAVTGDWSVQSIMMSILGSGVSVLNATGTFAKVGQKLAAFGQKVAPKLTGAVNKFALNFEKVTKAINQKIASFAPDKIIEKAMNKWTGGAIDSTFEDNKLIFQKHAELETFGQVRTEKTINSIKYNPNPTSWIKSAHFVETKFIDRNNIIGVLTIFYYKNNDSRLGRRKHDLFNGNQEIVAISIPNSRYKNDYVSGICRAKSWGSYYMRTWMLGKPGRGPEGINTSIFFGSEWRVDKRLKALFNQYKNIDKALINYSKKTAIKFFGKTKIGTKLLSYKDVFNKTKTAYNQVKNSKAEFLKPYLKRLKNK